MQQMLRSLKVALSRGAALPHLHKNLPPFRKTITDSRRIKSMPHCNSTFSKVKYWTRGHNLQCLLPTKVLGKENKTKQIYPPGPQFPPTPHPSFSSSQVKSPWSLFPWKMAGTLWCTICAIQIQLIPHYALQIGYAQSDIYLWEITAFWAE